MKDNGSENMILYRVLFGSDAPLGRLQYDYITTFLTFLRVRYICSIADTKKLVSDAARFLKTVTAFLEQ